MIMKMFCHLSKNNLYSTKQISKSLYFIIYTKYSWVIYIYNAIDSLNYKLSKYNLYVMKYMEVQNICFNDCF